MILDSWPPRVYVLVVFHFGRREKYISVPAFAANGGGGGAPAFAKASADQARWNFGMGWTVGRGFGEGWLARRSLGEGGEKCLLLFREKIQVIQGVMRDSCLLLYTGPRKRYSIKSMS